MTGWMSERVGEQVVSSCVGECVRGRAGGFVCECVCGGRAASGGDRHCLTNCEFVA